LIFPRHLLMWLSIIVLAESKSEAKKFECTTLLSYNIGSLSLNWGILHQ
jgi:hypothetical protein